jgi:hypothetical protein
MQNREERRRFQRKAMLARAKALAITHVSTGFAADRICFRPLRVDGVEKVARDHRRIVIPSA